MKNNIFPILVAVALVVLLILLTDPFMLYMPGAAAMAVLLAATMLAGVWAGFVIHEKAIDEREALHRSSAGRIAYLSGLAMLTLALLIQGLAHAIDPWIAATLGVMVLTKLIARLYTGHYR